MTAVTLLDTGPLLTFLARDLKSHSDFRVYRRHGNRVIPTLSPP